MDQGNTTAVPYSPRTMNSARDRAENIIDDLQAFLNTQNSLDESSPSPDDNDLSRSSSSHQLKLQMTLMNGHGSNSQLERWDSFHLPASIPAVESSTSVDNVNDHVVEDSKLPGSSEVFMTVGNEFTLKETRTFSTTLNVTKTESVQVNGVQQVGVVQDAGVKTEQVKGADTHVKHVTHIGSDGRTSSGSAALSSSSLSSSSSDDTKHDSGSSAQPPSPPSSATTTPVALKVEAVQVSGVVRKTEVTHLTKSTEVTTQVSSGVSAEVSAKQDTGLSSVHPITAETGEVETGKPQPSTYSSERITHFPKTLAHGPEPITHFPKTLSDKSEPITHFPKILTESSQPTPLSSDPTIPTSDPPTDSSPQPPPSTEPTTTSPPPKTLQEVMPFPMIFRRSKKDPGSKQYNALVKELEQVLVTRSKVARSHSLRHDLDMEDVPEVVGTLRGTKKLSSSTESLSIFSNKALLNRLESHLKNRGNPFTDKKPFLVAEKGDGVEQSKAEVQLTETKALNSTHETVVKTRCDSGKKTSSTPLSGHVTEIRTSSFTHLGSGHFTETKAPATGSVSLVNGQAHSVTSMNVSDSGKRPHLPQGQLNARFQLVGVGQTPANTKMSSEEATHDVSVIQVSADAAQSSSRTYTELVGNAGVHSPQDLDSFSQEMSFGSEEEFPSPYHISTLPNHGLQYKRHHVVRATHGHVHHSRVNPDVTFKSQTIDNSFRHITRIAVSKSADSIPQALEHRDHQEPSSSLTIERQSSLPMKTIVEHFSETDLEEVPAWNAALKNSKKHKEKGIYRSISQRMVQKIIRFVRPKSTGSVNSSVSRSRSFNQAPKPSSAGASSSQSDVSRVVDVSNHVSHNVSATSNVSTISTGKETQSVKKGGKGKVLSNAEGSSTVELRHKHKASSEPISADNLRISGGVVTVAVAASSEAALSEIKHVSKIQSVGAKPQVQTAAVPVRASTGLISHSSQPSLNTARDSGLIVDLPNNHKAAIVPIIPSWSGAISTNRNGTPQVSVSPQKRSVQVTRTPSHRQTYRPSDKGSPFTQEIGEGVLPPAYGDGLYRGEEDKSATFFIDARGMTGEPSVQVDGPNSIAKCSIDPRPDGQYSVTYIPVEVGMFDVQVKWNGKELPGSPYHPKVVCARKVQVVGGWQHFLDSKDRIHLVINEEKQIPFDVSEAGPGKMTAEVKSPSGLIPVTVDDSVVGRSTVLFTPREEGIHSVYLYWSDTPLAKSPIQGYATSGVLDPSKVILTGRGLKEAIVREEAEFTIDASQAGAGDPEVQLTGVKAEVPVFVTPLGGGKFRCTYIPVVPGAYLLHITWNSRQLRGSPYKVNVMGAFYPHKVAVSGEGLKGGLLGRDLDIRIDTRKAGPGELTAYCMGPAKVAHCELEDHHDGTFRLIVRPQEVGRHVLQVKYGGEHVLGSPFAFKVSAQPDASKVRVSGPGVEHGILATFQSRFVVETRGAGAGQLTVRIRGPKGAFQVEMYRDSQKDRTILCRYDPTETGLYIISIRWSGVDVPGSPFHVHILDTQAELEQVLSDQSFHNQSFQNQSFHSSRAPSGYSQWREEF